MNIYNEMIFNIFIIWITVQAHTNNTHDLFLMVHCTWWINTWWGPVLEFLK